MTLQEAHERLRKATRPKQIFGAVATLAEAKKAYLQLAKITHEDMCEDKETAKSAFQELERLWSLCQKEFSSGAYHKTATAEIKSAKNTYAVIGNAISGDLTSVFPALFGDQKVFIKISKSPKLNHFLIQEASTLAKLHEIDAFKEIANGHLPKCLESFLINGAYANVITTHKQKLYTIKQVRAEHEKGVDGRTLSWMFKRLLAALGVAHESGFVHGAITPENFMISPEDHNGFLIDWCYSKPSGETIKAIVPSYKGFYAPEILLKKPATSASDIYMTAMLMLYVSGGEVKTKSFPDHLPKGIESFIRACLIASPSQRPNDALVLHHEFSELLLNIYGKPHFHHFHMNGKF